VRAAREEKSEREKERVLQIKFYTEKKSSLLVRRKKLRLKILSWVEGSFRHGRVEDGSFRRVRSNMK